MFLKNAFPIIMKKRRLVKPHPRRGYPRRVLPLSPMAKGRKYFHEASEQGVFVPLTYLW